MIWWFGLKNLNILYCFFVHINSPLHSLALHNHTITPHQITSTPHTATSTHNRATSTHNTTTPLPHTQRHQHTTQPYQNPKQPRHQNTQRQHSIGISKLNFLPFRNYETNAKEKVFSQLHNRSFFPLWCFSSAENNLLIAREKIAAAATPFGSLTLRKIKMNW